MNLTEHYNQLYTQAIGEIKSTNCQTDPLLNLVSDDRLGLTLLIRPSRSVKCKILSFLDELKIIEPDQYYYPDSDIHVTLLSIISCYSGFELTRISIPDYVEVINNCLADSVPFQIEMKGITASPSCVMIQGFLADDTLNNLRDSLRVSFKTSGLEQSIDKRYAIQTAHSTVVRFRNQLTKKAEYIAALENYREFDFGTFRVDSVELVCNDWYHRAKHEKLLHRFEIRK